MESVTGSIYKPLGSQPKKVESAFCFHKKISRDYRNQYLRENICTKPSTEAEISGDLYFYIQTFKRASKLPKFNSPFKALSSAKKRKLQIHSVPKAGLRYRDFVGLHQLWLQYMEETVRFNEPNFSAVIQQRDHLLLRADYHGCLVKVTQSKCPSYVGTSGIIIQETKETFKIINKDNQVKIVPKRNSVFTFRLGSYELNIYGNNFNFRPMDRINKKFKSHYSIDL